MCPRLCKFSSFDTYTSMYFLSWNSWETNVISVGLNVPSWCYEKAGSHFKDKVKLRTNEKLKAVATSASRCERLREPFVSLTWWSVCQCWFLLLTLLVLSSRSMFLYRLQCSFNNKHGICCMLSSVLAVCFLVEMNQAYFNSISTLCITSFIAYCTLSDTQYVW